MSTRKLEMRYAGGGIVRHLGLQNYKGPVPALAELIANAWDADATQVEVNIPFGLVVKPSDAITLKDNGCGMTWAECNEKYLVIGRNRRVAEDRDESTGGRPLMAHKGLGKLAGFGIANVVEVRTVRNKKLTHFIMRFKDIDKLDRGETYEPQMLADEEETKLSDGTEVILKDLSIECVIDKSSFLRSMALRFAVLSDKFKVYINSELLTKEKVPLEFRFPEQVEGDVTEIMDGRGKTTLPNSKKIEWWIGFTPKPIHVEVVQGVSIVTRGRLSQDPWDFGLSGGVHGQHGLRYMTGEIIADFLDEGQEKEGDLVITNRSNVMWDHPKARPLFDWAREKIRSLLTEWSERRSEKTVQKIQEDNPTLVEKIKQFPERERKELNSAMKKFAEVPDIEPDKLVEIFAYVIDGYRDRAFVQVLEEIKELPPEQRMLTLDILKDFDVLEAVRVHRIVFSHVEVIRAFQEMIDEGVPEKPDMHEHIRRYPWLLGIRYQSMDYEKSLQTILEARLGISKEAPSGQTRPDFVCMRGGKEVLVIELKRPKEEVGLNELHQISGYVDILREWARKYDSNKVLGTKIDEKDIKGYLIAYDFKDDPRVDREIRRLEADDIHVCPWHDILRKAEDDHKEFLNIVRKRAPKDDPRVKELEDKEIA